MNAGNMIYWITTSVGAVAFGCAVMGSIFFTGEAGQLLTRIAGVVLVIVVAASGRVKSGKQVGDGVGGRLQDAISLIGLIAAIILGYLIYVVREELPNRRLYIAAAAIVVVIVFMISYLVPYLRAKQRVRGM